jgi:phosphoglycerol transferase
MILPNPDYRIGILARARDHFDDVFPELSNENKSATLGLTATIGLCILLGCLIARGRRKVPETLEHGALLTLAAIIVATTGGLGAVFNRFITPDIRAYNRISTWISFFCLLAVAYALERLWFYLKERGKPNVYFAIAASIAILGVLDQSPRHRPPYEDSHRQEVTDRAWIDQIGATIPSSGTVLQLPYSEDLETRLGLLQQLPFMLSPDLHWSVGAFRGTPEAHFESWLSTLQPRSMVAAALLSGFDGILIYRDEYKDHAAALESGIQAITGRLPLVGEDQSQSFFPIHGLAAAARTADPAVGTPQGISEAVDISRSSGSSRTEPLPRIEDALHKSR